MVDAPFVVEGTDWKILEELPKHFRCICLRCNREYTRQKYCILGKRSVCCRTCKDEDRRAKIIGRQYGDLTIISFVDNADYGNRGRYLCSCKCGNQAVISLHELLNGHTKSCGCGRHKGLTAEDIAWNLRYHYTKKGATCRDLAWELTLVEVKELCSSPCHYCGQKKVWNQGIRHAERTARDQEYTIDVEFYKKGTLEISGIDRVDTTIGYIFTNCVPCCRTCNVRKGKKTYERFVREIKDGKWDGCYVPTQEYKKA